MSTNLLKILSFFVLTLLLTGTVTSIPTNTEPYDYFTYEEMTDLFFELANNHSDIMSVSSIGKTYEGRDIWLVKLSDNVEEDEDEAEVLLMGAHHGNERPSFEVLIYFINFIVEKYNQENTDDDQDGYVNEDVFDGIDNDLDLQVDEDPSETRITNIIDTTEIYLIPMVNPDGVEFGWRKNRAPNYGPYGFADEITSYGVDLNRNYGFRWFLPYIFPDNYYFEYLTDDESGIYRGVKPFSENESSAVKAFVEDHDIQISLSYHDWGEWMIFPWMHTSRHTPHEALFRSIGYNISQINKYELKIYGQYGEKDYLIPRFCGTPGSSENWLYGRHEILAYTVELCERRPEIRPDKVLDACWKHVGVNLYVCERAQTVEEEKQQIKSSRNLFEFFW